MSSDFVVHLGLHQLQLLKGDITAIAVDAIVNAANAELAGGGGVDGAIYRAGGPEIMKELDRVRAEIGRCEPGHAVATGAGKLPAKYVFHAVGPIYRGGGQGEAEALASCYRTCLDMAAERGAMSVSFPSISTGVYGYPIEEAAGIAVRTVSTWLHDHAEPVRVVKLIQFSDHDHAVYRRHAQNLRGEAPGAAAGG